MSNGFFYILLGIPLVGAALCGLIKERRFLEGISVISTALTVLCAFWLTWYVLQGNVLSSPQAWFFADALSAYLILIVTMSALAASVYSVGYLRAHLQREHFRPSHFRLYYSLLQVFLFTMLLVLISNNLGMLWVGTEATTLATAFLVAFYDDEYSLEAAWKYVIICSVGIALALFGIILTYFSALNVIGASSSALNWTTLMSVAPQLDAGVLKLAFIFTLIGFGTKAGLAPMHTWKPDAYSEAPAPISALMAAGLVNVAIYALLRFFALVNRGVGEGFASGLFVIFGLISMLIAVPFALAQRDVKRLLAYSSVEHVGIVIFAFGIGTPLAVFGGLFHLFNNAVGKLLLFLTAGDVRLAFDSKIIRRITGAIKIIPLSATLLMVGIFASTGWPPFGTFFSELSIVTAGFAAGQNAATALFILCVTAVFGGFIYYGTGMVFGTPSPGRPPVERNLPGLVVLSVLAAVLVLVGIWMPPALLSLIKAAAAALKG